MNILGLNWGAHDSAACLVQGNELIAAVEEERFNRQKHAPFAFPQQAARSCLAQAGLEIDEVDEIVFSFDPRVGLGRSLGHALRFFPRANFTVAAEAFRRVWYAGASRWARYFLKAGRTVRGRTVPHHHAHAASAFFVSPFDQAAILTVDGMGEWPVTTLMRGQGTRLIPIKTINFPQSLGLLYSAFTEYLGFVPFNDEFKIMGLAAYGKPAYRQQFADIVRLKPEGEYELDLSYFNFQFDYGARTWYGPKMIDVFGPPRQPDDELDERHADVAASLQERLEQAVLHILHHLRRVTGLSDLCLAGGVALNSVMNGKILRYELFKRLFIQPAANDAGCALGGALYAAHVIHNLPRGAEMRHVYLGPAYGTQEIEGLLRNCRLRYQVLDDPARRGAELLAQGKILGWFQGRMEFGPRALGNRSILADPRRPEMKDRINAAVKYREPFRPFAPSVLAERSLEFFADVADSPFMLLVTDVHPDKKSLVPATTHTDGTARLHTVEQQVNPLYWQLIHHFGELTGVPVVLNTSFNTRGQPIVCTPREALSTFLLSGMDAMIIDRFLLQKPDAEW